MNETNVYQLVILSLEEGFAKPGILFNIKA